MFGFELWLRIIALLFTGVVIGALRPEAGIERSLLISSTIEGLSEGLKWRIDAAHLYTLRAYYLFDFVFLLAHGWFFHRLLNGVGISALAMMAMDTVENIAALFLIDAVVRGAEGGSPWFMIYTLAFAAKWIAVAWTYFTCLRMTKDGPWLWVRRLALGWALIAAVVYPVFKVEAVGLALAIGLAVFLVATGWAAPDSGMAFRSLFFIRAPLAALAVVAVSTAVAFGPLRAYLFGVLHFYNSDSGLGGFLFTATVAYFLAFLVPLQARIVLVHGVERLSMTAIDEGELRRILFFLQNALLASVTLLLAGGVAVTWGPVAPEHGLAALALVLAALLFAAADAIAGYLTAQPLRLPLLLLPGRLGKWWERQLPVLAARRVPGWVARISAWIARRRPCPEQGYFDSGGYLYAEHACAAGLFFIAAAIFGGVMVWVLGFEWPPPQTLASLCLLGIVITSAVSAIAFFFDRYRIPAILVLLALRAATGLPQGLDNVFLSAPDTNVKYLTPGQVLKRFAGREAVLIAASGGGIQAAAWMAHVIHNIDREKGIRSRIALISGVSGGSIAAYHLGGEWKNADWDKTERAVQRSSLGPVAAALLGPDLFRPLLAWNPAGRHMDRGFALEFSIERHHEEETNTDPRYTMDDWAAEAGHGMPAMLFNTTVVETGAPVAFATTEMPSGDYLKNITNPMGVGHPVESWHSVHAKHCGERASRNVKVSTAARLSATFPYVSPAARLEAEGDCLPYHFVDGGYYDNYGVVGLLQWLDDALEEIRATPSEMPSSIRVVVIRGLVPLPEEAGGGAQRADQATAPLVAFLNMRSYAQWRGAAVAMRLFEDKWRGTAKFEPTVRIAYPELNKHAPECSEEPLTWKVTPSQQRCIAEAWRYLKGAEPGILEAFGR